MYSHDVFRSSDVVHRDLHSFPTRRSSDLTLTTPQTIHPAAEIAVPANRPRKSRSEEHTSELQSRRELVCRPLLEKKKTNTPMTRAAFTGIFGRRARHAASSSTLPACTDSR